MVKTTQVLLLGVLFAACASTTPEGDPTPEFEQDTPVVLPYEGFGWVEDVAVPGDLAPLEPEARSRLGALVASLSSKDFAGYSTAAGALVELGERAVPYLGHMGEPPTRRDRAFRVITVILVPILMQVEPRRLGARFRSPYRAVRTAAATVVAERHLLDHAPELVRLLDDGQLAVRQAAIRALRVLYNQFYGYRPADRPEDRAAATRRWQKQLAPR